MWSFIKHENIHSNNEQDTYTSSENDDKSGHGLQFGCTNYVGLIMWFVS